MYSSSFYWFYIINYATGREEEEDDKMLVRDEPDKAITSVFCRDLH